MTKIELEIFDDVISTLNKIHGINDSGIELVIPEGSILFENVLNLKLIKKRSEKFSQSVHFSTSDPNGLALIEMVEEENGGFSNPSIFHEEMSSANPTMQISSKKTFSFAKLSEPIALWLKPFKNFKPYSVKSIMVPVVIALVLVLGYHFIKNNRQATIRIVINSQPLTKSVTVKVKANTPSSAQYKTLAGINLQNTLELSKETPTTGEKTVGEKAKGTAKIFNKTDSDKTFKKGQVLVYDDNGKDLNFVTNEDIDVPARVDDPAGTATFGTVEVEVTASVVGSQYNIDKDEPLQVYNYKKADYSAVAKEDFTGGKSETKKIVAQADITKASTELDTDLTAQAEESLKSKVASSQTFVAGSFKATPLKENTDKKVGEEADKVTVTKAATVEGLVYQKSELDRLLDELLKEFIPDGFILSTKDREINVAVLGNSSTSVLSPTEADIQVTIKSFVVPNIAEDDVKKELAGKSSAEAQKILGGVRNIDTFALNVDKGILPIFNTVPKDLSKIKVEIVKK
jgi:hypothetical protein